MLLLAGGAYMLWRMLELLQLLMLDVRILGEARRGVVRRRRRCRCWWWNQRRRQFFAQRVQPVEHNRFHESLLKKRKTARTFWNSGHRKTSPFRYQMFHSSYNSKKSFLFGNSFHFLEKPNLLMAVQPIQRNFYISRPRLVKL